VLSCGWLADLLGEQEMRLHDRQRRFYAGGDLPTRSLPAGRDETYNGL
jgi:hypothetical protein